MNKKIQDFIFLNLGLMISAVGISLFKTPNHFVIGGTSGAAILVAKIFPSINVGMAMLILNTILVILGFIFIGKSFGGYVIYSSFALAGYVWIMETLVPLSAPLTEDTFLELIYAIVLPGIGAAIAFNVGASTGGTDIVALILKKYIRVETGTALLISDFGTTLIAGFYFGTRAGLYCILGLFFKTFVIDLGIESLNRRKYLTIISDHPEEIKKFILEKLQRGANIHTVIGAYSEKERQVITTVVSNRQSVTLRNFIKSIDPGAFITIVNSSETVGKGFRSI